MSNNTKTVLVLVAIMLASGLLIPQAYMRYLNKRDFRPPFEKALTKNIQILDDLRGVTSLSEFEDEIWLAYCSSTQAENENTLIHKKVQALRARFPDQTLKAAVFLVDVPTDQPEALKAYREAQAEFLTESDYLIASNVEVLQKYIKNEFQFSLLPYDKEGVWLYDQNLIILDRIPADKNGKRPVLAHMRGHLDFVRAIEQDQIAMESHASQAPHEEQLNQLLVGSIQYLIDNPDEEDAALSGEQQK